MSLSEIMSAMQLHVFAEVGLVVFGAAFLCVLVTTFLGRNREAFERARFIPLDEEPAARRAEAPGHE